MPRMPRLLEDDKYYHILTRGNDRKRIFRHEQDYLYFLRLISQYILKYPVLIYHYCVMDNHMHFLIEAIEARDVPKFLQAILQCYAAYFRKRYNHSGFLFQNRYKSYLIDKESYLLDCARYIERNPLRAKIIGSLRDYRWSSYLFYTEGCKDDIIKIPNPLYLQLAETGVERRRLYNEYILQERPYDAIVDKALKIY